MPFLACVNKIKKLFISFVITAAFVPEMSWPVWGAFEYRLGLWGTLESKRLRTTALDALWIQMTLTSLLDVILHSLVIVIIGVSVIGVGVQGLTVTHGGEHGLHCTHKHTPSLIQERCSRSTHPRSFHTLTCSFITGHEADLCDGSWVFTVTVTVALLVILSCIIRSFILLLCFSFIWKHNEERSGQTSGNQCISVWKLMPHHPVLHWPSHTGALLERRWDLVRLHADWWRGIQDRNPSLNHQTRTDACEDRKQLH